MSRRLLKKSILVTGGGCGIGRATSLLLASEGACVMVSDNNIESGELTAELIRESGGDAHFFQADVRCAEQVKALIDAVVNTNGRLDCAFNNAGILEDVFISTSRFTESSWDRIIDVNLKGVWLCMKYEIQQMLGQDGGCIVNMSSVAGLYGNRYVGPAYIASKHGVVGLTKAAAIEYAQNGIRVNSVCPGIVQPTVMSEAIFGEQNSGREAQIKALYPMGRVCELDEVSQAVVWLCSDDASFINGHALPIEGGLLAQ